MATKRPSKAPSVQRRPRKVEQMFMAPPQTVAPVDNAQRGVPGMFMPPQLAQMQGQGINGAAGKRPAWLDTAGDVGLGVGIGLLTGDNWGEGIGQGLLHARNFGQDRQQSERLAADDAREQQRFDYTMQKDRAATDKEAAQVANFNAMVDQLQIPDEQKAFMKAQGPGSVSFNDMFSAADQGPASVQEYEYAKQQGFTGSLLDWEKQKAEAGRAPQQPPQDPETIRLMQAAGIDPSSPEGQALIKGKLAGSGGVQITGYDEQGRPLISVGGPGGKPLTEGQSVGTMQFSLAEQANKALGEMDTLLTDPGDYIASQFGTPGNYFKSPQYQQAEQSATVMAEQYLRALTGAAAPDAEVARTAKSIMPQPGDGPEVIAQKRATRETIIQALRIKAGPGAAQTESAAPTGGPKPGAPMVGQVMDGYRYKGGDPADQNSWEKVQ